MKAYFLSLFLILNVCTIKPICKTKKIQRKQTPAIIKSEQKPIVVSSKPSSVESDTKATPESDISISNNIDYKKDTTYKWGFISYTPNKFVFKINGQEIAPGKTISIQASKKMMVRYDYEFANGKRKGSKEIEFELDPKAKELDMRFSWNNEWRVVFKNGATPVKVTRVEG